MDFSFSSPPHLITHYHPDHWYGASTFKELGTTVIAHKNLNEFFKTPESKLTLELSKQRFGGIYKNVKPTQADVEITSPKDISIGKYSHL